ncbi:MAG: Gfo/Idh/MocA family oxidoreductase [Anaerolineales bacterium]
MKILISGFGSIGRRHFRNLKSLGERDILFHRTGFSQLPNEELAGLTVENDLAAALGRKPDAVIVANPTALHLDVAIPAANAGCALFLEKPISHNIDRVAELERAARASGSRLLVGFQYRFHPGLQKAYEFIASGELGKPLSARAHWGEFLPSWHPWEDYRRGYSARSDLGGGVVLTLCHPFDYLRMLLGDVASVWASTAHSGELDIDVEDQAEIGLEFESGALGSIHLDYLQKPGSHWLEVTCAHGALRLDFSSNLLKITRSSSSGEQEFPAPVGFERNDLFLAQMRHFIEVAKGETQPKCTLTDGRKALELALAVHASAVEGHKVIP